MCGFVAVFHAHEKPEIDERLLTSMNNALTHRGPDEHGVYCQPGIGLAHRRLSIIDLSSGQQPLFNEDRSVVVVYNGEIYNFRELQQELVDLGHGFRTHSDTEVIVHAWEQWGTGCVERFRGMFAFALWDENSQTFFLARDRLGIKPIYYWVTGSGAILVASELKALRLHPEFPSELDPLAVEDYLGFGYIPEPRTIYKAARKLPPAQWLLWRRGETSPRQESYWDVDLTASPCQISLEDAVDGLEQQIAEAVRVRLVAEVPLGAFLSGGVDSSAVVATMAGILDEPVNTCSIAFEDPQFDESDYAAEVARRYDTEHYSRQIDVDDFSLLDSLDAIYDEPFADSSALPTFRVCEVARSRVTVALSGDGGDEVLAGYSRYGIFSREEARYAAIPKLLRGGLGMLGAHYPHYPWMPRPLRARYVLQALGRDAVGNYFNLNAVLKDDDRIGLYSAQQKSELQGYRAVEVLRKHAQKAPADNPLRLAQYLDMKTYLPGDILTKVDRASMAHSLEVRVPLLDHKLIEWCATLPDELKRSPQGVGKYLLKRAMEPRLPHDVLYRRKMGFAVPLAKWFRGPLRQRLHDAILGERLAATGMLRRSKLDRILQLHDSGKVDFSAALWALLMFDAFLKREMAS